MNNLSILPNDNIAEEPPAPPKQPPLEFPKISWTYVKVLDLDMSFGTMVWFMVKWAFAAIPAMLIILAIYLFILAALAAGGYGVGSMIK